jgi:N-acetylneuraminate synthase
MVDLKLILKKKCFIIAEIGINHNGSLDIAKKLIDIAKQSGCDAVKFQKRTIEIVYDKKTLDSPRESPWGNTQRDQKEGIEFSKKEYDEIDNYCKKKNIEWFASAWDLESLIFLDQYKFKNHKIASVMTTNKEFLLSVAKRKIHTFISTGMTKTSDIDYAVNIFRENNCDFTLMHTVSTYPCQENELHLINIINLREKYKCKVGYSGHEVSPGPSIIAVCLGAEALERHITLDRSMYGSDQSASLERGGLKLTVDYVRKIPVVFGDKLRENIFDSEIPTAKKLRYWEK